MAMPMIEPMNRTAAEDVQQDGDHDAESGEGDAERPRPRLEGPGAVRERDRESGQREQRDPEQAVAPPSPIEPTKRRPKPPSRPRHRSIAARTARIVMPVGRVPVGVAAAGDELVEAGAGAAAGWGAGVGSGAGAAGGGVGSAGVGSVIWPVPPSLDLGSVSVRRPRATPS